MPGRFFLTDPISDLTAALDVPAGVVDNEPARQNISPSQEIIVFDGALTRMRWGIVPVGRVNARGRPVMQNIINARSETLFEKPAFKGVGRAVIPVNGWYEWTGEKRKKTAWRIAPKGGGFLYFAAVTDVWTAPGGLQVPQVAAVTCEPNADVAPIHHRMGVLLERADLDTWMGTEIDAVKALMQPWPVGRLKIEEATGVDWKGP
ncbi:SOS response-associated peptidase [Tateyamaria omphalii]|uniref:SOS response-associated peptidase n=1 Tax=Tateyamaria omphalii TaxID=299262 RepID=UPI001C991820|nr:SOS response-associated peptidase [Tateyamaria omphalii]MBY5934804.1 SOS response-associated peptidase [Tateyamaria omphalii]